MISVEAVPYSQSPAIMGTVLTYRVLAGRRFYGIVRKRRFNRCETGLNPFDVMFQNVKADHDKASASSCL